VYSDSVRAQIETLGEVARIDTPVNPVHALPTPQQRLSLDERAQTLYDLSTLVNLFSVGFDFLRG